jgi:hypothetical protein
MAQKPGTKVFDRLRDRSSSIQFLHQLSSTDSRPEPRSRADVSAVPRLSQFRTLAASIEFRTRGFCEKIQLCYDPFGPEGLHARAKPCSESPYRPVMIGTFKM